jgi:hypothetical protein
MEEVRKNRICVSLWAASYEFLAHSFVSDARFDEVCKLVERDLHVDTDRPDMDKWFRENFSAHTGQWVHSHRDRDYLKRKAQHLIWLQENPL